MINSKGTNAAIQARILPFKQMQELGFTDYNRTEWYYCTRLQGDITFNLTIPKDGSDIEIITLDEMFCQPYDYQAILKHNPNHPFASKIRDKVEEQMKYLQSVGVLSGHEEGDYI